jgi:hypothetical protein
MAIMPETAWSFAKLNGTEMPIVVSHNLFSEVVPIKKRQKPSRRKQKCL